MTNAPSVRARLAALDEELRRLDGRRHVLLRHRAHLLSLLAAAPPATAPPAWPAPPPGAAAWPAAPQRPREVAPRGAQNTLLALGGTLLATAAVVFTAVSWGTLGDGGRTAVLTLVTVAALAAPAVLARRGLGATAQTVSVLGLLLTVLDTAGLASLTGAGGFAFAGGAALALAALWTGYGLALPALLVPLPAAVFAGQFAGVCWAVAAGAPPLVLAWTLLATGVADAAVALTAARPALRVSAAVAAAATGGSGMLAGGWWSLAARTAAGAALPGLLLLAGAAAASLAAARARFLTVPAAVLATLAAVAAVGDAARHAVPDGWAVTVYPACAAAALAAARPPLPRAAARAVAASAAGVAGACVLWVAPVPLLVLAESAAGVRADAGPLPAGAAAAVLAAVALLLPPAARRSAGPRWAAAAGSAALALGAAAVVALPAALGLGRVPTAVLLLALVAALAVVAVRPVAAAGTAVAVTAAGSATVCCVPLVALAAGAHWPLLVPVLGALAVLGAGVASAGGRGVGRAPLTVRAAAGPWAVVCAAACGWTAAVAAGLPAPAVAFALLPVPAAVAALLVAGVPLPRPVLAGMETAGAAAALAALCRAAAAPAALAPVLTLCALLAAGTAVRPERRTAGTYTAAGLLVAAVWVWLARAGVAAPEAYTAPVALPLLAVGAVQRRGDRTASSWAAYGPGLALALVPSLGAAWLDAHWLRPLLLGVAALAATLAGGRRGLLAPLTLGGAVLALDALHELAPYVVQVAGLVPRWVPMALAGALLLAAGATYEHRLRDVRRLRAALGRMH
ncbi:hypothetical protein AB0910_23660 [Streptomyces sp. NPDC047002]|uniref:SCO7613 C-terminal domain-containing membrane protein n=1 Tax=Streptomyces sp. NPDC047002 TaxID=3155475 RepID=UPI00345532F6